ncbi:YqaE/Pmp3 family membrane protein [uncultured Sphingomonas sp.]|uniref:YqaE/Pmp3 family membrane protein n=1 Tax=uncultured Sphingomonas sp. TaxID=158754 RepID=UPI0035CC659D
MSTLTPNEAVADVPGRRPGHLAAAALVPPLGLHLAAVRPREFWIGTGLTVLGFVPGAVFALYLLLRRSGPVAT